MNTIILFVLFQIVAVASLFAVVKVLRITKPQATRVAVVLLLSEIALGASWGLAQIFALLGLVGLLLPAVVFAYGLRMKPPKALLACVLWDVLVFVLMTAVITVAQLFGMTLV